MKMSSTFKAGQTAADLREQGFDVIDLTVGEPDFPTPEFIKEYAWEGLDKGYHEIYADRRSEIFSRINRRILRRRIRRKFFAERNHRN